MESGRACRMPWSQKWLWAAQRGCWQLNSSPLKAASGLSHWAISLVPSVPSSLELWYSPERLRWRFDEWGWGCVIRRGKVWWLHGRYSQSSDNWDRILSHICMPSIHQEEHLSFTFEDVCLWGPQGPTFSREETPCVLGKSRQC